MTVDITKKPTESPDLDSIQLKQVNRNVRLKHIVNTTN